MYNHSDTIASLATGPGGTIAVIRISGRNAFDISSKILKPDNALKEPKNGVSYLLKVVDENNQIIDRAIVIAYINPKSFTGEDMVEIFCHNSPYIVKKIIELLTKNGARQAIRGEFSFRAFINGKMDLSQAEGLNELIKAETEKQHRIAINQANGKLSRKIDLIKDSIINLLSEIEVRIDDNYEEMENIDISNYLENIESTMNDIKKLVKSYEKANFIKNGIKIAIVGSPNSGKSSLLNRILGYERAITSEIPGTTRDTIEAVTHIGGIKAIFTDTAGIRANSNDKIEIEGMERTKNAIRTSDIIIYLEDVSKPQSDDDKLAVDMINKNIKKGAKLIKTYSKSDLEKTKQEKDFLYTSSKTGENLDKLLSTISNTEENVIDSAYDEIITSQRQKQCLENSLKELIKAREILSDSNYEIVAEHLRMSLNHLEDITGKTTSDDILKNIFKNFCVGK